MSMHQRKANPRRWTRQSPVAEQGGVAALNRAINSMHKADTSQCWHRATSTMPSGWTTAGANCCRSRALRGRSRSNSTIRLCCASWWMTFCVSGRPSSDTGLLSVEQGSRTPAGLQGTSKLCSTKVSIRQTWVVDRTEWAALSPVQSPVANTSELRIETEFPPVCVLNSFKPADRFFAMVHGM
jgi:hypothetical protein